MHRAPSIEDEGQRTGGCVKLAGPENVTRFWARDDIVGNSKRATIVTSPIVVKAIRQHAFALVRSVSVLSTETSVVATRGWGLIKRGIDLALAALLLLATLPVLLAIAAAIKLDSRGPVLFRVHRVGYRGRPLMMLKFRKMHHDASGGPLTTGSDPRLTRVGAVLTRTRLDELPQLWDVLRGRMSVIGPRPEDPRFVALHPEHYEDILRVRPGITGVSQLAFAKERVILDDDDPVGHYVSRILPQKISLDTLYARRSSLRMDFSIIFWTLVAVIIGLPVAVHRSTGRMNVRRRRQPLPAPKPADASASEPALSAVAVS
jgi:lipopolysaccharide/colanic/teichoic acid biosynthesis glycosyltransferase